MALKEVLHCQHTHCKELMNVESHSYKNKTQADAMVGSQMGDYLKVGLVEFSTLSQAVEVTKV